MGVLMKNKIDIFLCLLLGFVGGVFIKTKHFTLQLNKAKMDSDKHLMLFLMMNQWVKIKQDGINISEYFERKKYYNVAIYGMSYVGQTLVKELDNTKIKVEYGIDENKDNIYADIDIFAKEDPLKKVDVIVVTAITFFDEIEKELHKIIDCPIVSLGDILFEY